jgi:hypothetical protein
MNNNNLNENCIIECSQNQAIENNNDSYYTNKLSENIKVPKGSTISILNSFVNIRNANTDTIEIINNNEKICNGKTRITISFYKTANGKNMVMAPYSWSISGLQNNQLYYNTSKDSIIFSEDQAQTNYNLKDINGGNVNTTSNALYNMVNYTDLKQN